MVSIGKFRHLSQCTTPDGHFVVLAIDHRANLREALAAARGVPIGDEDVADFKRDVMIAVGDLCSGILGDPAFVLGYGISEGLLPGRQGLIAPVEVTNYAAHPSERDVQFIPYWNVEKAKRAGLSGLKLLIYFNPDTGSAPERLRLVNLLTGVCARYDIPLFLEPILYAPANTTQMDAQARVRATIQMVRMMAETGPDVLKLEFPIDLKVEQDSYFIEDSLDALNDACGNIPWVLLSGGVDGTQFARQVMAASKAGCSGFMVGRALWNPAIKASAGGSDSRLSILQTRGRQELEALAEIVKSTATPFWNKTGRPKAAFNWYEDYSGFNGGK